MNRLLIVVVLALACQVSIFASETEERSNFYAQEYRREVEAGRLRERTNLALDALIRYAAFELRVRGHKDNSEELLKEWEGGWSLYLVVERGLGDHAPLSQWLAEKYAMIEFLLGVDICHSLRLDDINTINFGLPVVVFCEDGVDVDEYKLHFVPFSGVVVYWGSFFACVGGTWGTGFLYCTPIAWGAEFATKEWVAPALNQPVWRLACQ